jgi:hypothetical protein
LENRCILQGFAATGTPQVVLIKLHYCGPGLLFWLLLLPNKEWSTVLALHSSVAKILQNPVVEISIVATNTNYYNVYSVIRVHLITE